MYARLASREHDGRVMGIRMRQGKTDRWVGVPVVGEPRAQIEPAIAASRKLGLTTILHDEKNERPWTSNDPAERRAPDTVPVSLQPDPPEGRRHPHPRRRHRSGGPERRYRVPRCPPHLRRDDGPVRDHRISVITGHRLSSVKKILETYLPRTTGMAMLAVDSPTIEHRGRSPARQRAHDPGSQLYVEEQAERRALLKVRSFIVKHGKAQVDAYRAQRLHDIRMDASHRASLAPRPSLQ